MSKECNAEPAAAANAANAPAPGTLGSRAARLPGTAGTVQSISGSTVTLKGLQNNATVTVQLSDNTTIRKQVTKAITDLQPGMQFFALGQLSGNTLTARQIQVLAPGETAPAGGFGFNGGAGRAGGGGGNGANGGANAGNGGAATGNAGAGATGRVPHRDRSAAGRRPRRNRGKPLRPGPPIRRPGASGAVGQTLPISRFSEPTTSTTKAAQLVMGPRRLSRASQLESAARMAPP